jgi:hypothetical protein
MIYFIMNWYFLAQNCGLNEEFNECGTSCPATCETINAYADGLVSCNMRCNAGCFCKDGYVRDAKRNNECVLKQDCNQEL